uniref:DNA mismatch repair endonuclease MutL n=1 Tax=Ndongobacter massiliensis TaxID=1871025 RepID=UPI000931FD85|nr:DNA mismatch repair endonuclease MutL [Ndongobacter massiliensis]
MIRRLSEDTIQKIAAGEVIERPVSVVKELVENAVDAGADEIRVEIREGGKALIRVSDNGSGIAAEEFPLAFERHATSKIEQFEDLYRIHSLGFRGEALASIVAVARVRARSRVARAAVGTQLYLEESRIVKHEEIAMPVGTTIEVQDLFYNVPVRRRFLKSDAVESNRITQLLYSLAIGNPKISFSLTREDRRIFQTQAAYRMEQNLLLLFGRAYYEALRSFAAEKEAYRIHGFVGNNTFYRANRQLQFFFVNGRYIEDETLRDVVEQKYRSVIPNGRFPAFQIFIETDPSQIDINIHPNKQKIKFHHPDSLLNLLAQTVEQTLREASDLPAATFSEAKARKPLFADLSRSGGYEAVLESYRKARDAGNGKRAGESTSAETKAEKENETQKQREAWMRRIMETQQIEFSKTISEADASFSAEDLVLIEDEAEQEVEDSGDAEYTGVQDISRTVLPSADADDEAVTPSASAALLPSASHLRYLGTLFRTYLLLEEASADRCLLVDQHAAHERINYERFLKQFRNRTVVSQQLAPPLRIALTALQHTALQERENVLRACGFEFSGFGEKEVALRAVPVLFSQAQKEQLFLDLLDIAIDDLNDLDAVLDRVATRACKASVKQGDHLPEPEVWALYRDLQHCSYPLTCPHGRPTIIYWTKAEMEKLFLRMK